MAAKKFADAEQVLESSYRLYPGEGALFNLAICRERTGKSVLAARAYALVSKKTSREDRRKAANDRLRALSPLPGFILVPPQATVPKLVVKIDGEALEPEWYRGSEESLFPLAPGPHHMTSEAPGLELASGDFVVSPPQIARVEIPVPKGGNIQASASPPQPAAPMATTVAAPSQPWVGGIVRERKDFSAASNVLISLGVLSFIGGAAVGFVGLVYEANNESGEETRTNLLVGGGIAMGAGVVLGGTGLLLPRVPSQDGGQLTLLPSKGGGRLSYLVHF